MLSEKKQEKRMYIVCCLLCKKEGDLSIYMNIYLSIYLSIHLPIYLWWEQGRGDLERDFADYSFLYSFDLSNMSMLYILKK